MKRGGSTTMTRKKREKETPTALILANVVHSSKSPIFHSTKHAPYLIPSRKKGKAHFFVG